MCRCKAGHDTDPGKHGGGEAWRSPRYFLVTDAIEPRCCVRGLSPGGKMAVDRRPRWNPGFGDLGGTLLNLRDLGRIAPGTGDFLVRADLVNLPPRLGGGGRCAGRRMLALNHGTSAVPAFRHCVLSLCRLLVMLTYKRHAWPRVRMDI